MRAVVECYMIYVDIFLGGWLVQQPDTPDTTVAYQLSPSRMSCHSDYEASKRCDVNEPGQTSQQLRKTPKHPMDKLLVWIYW